MRNGMARTHFNSKTELQQNVSPPDYGGSSRNCYPDFTKGLVASQKAQQTNESTYLNQ